MQLIKQTCLTISEDTNVFFEHFRQNYVIVAAKTSQWLKISIGQSTLNKRAKRLFIITYKNSLPAK